MEQMLMNELRLPWNVGKEYEQLDPGIYIYDDAGSIILAPCGGGVCEPLTEPMARLIVQGVNKTFVSFRPVLDAS